MNDLKRPEAVRGKVGAGGGGGFKKKEKKVSTSEFVLAKFAVSRF